MESSKSTVRSSLDLKDSLQNCPKYNLDFPRFSSYKASKADKRAHLAKISSLKNQVSGEQVFADELDAEHAKVIL